MIFVSGGSGLLGTHLLYQLIKSGKKVRALKRHNSDLSEPKKVFDFYPEGEKYFNQIEWVDGDLDDVHSLEKALNNIQTVYHCAGLVEIQNGKYKELKKINIEGTANLINASIHCNVKEFCHVSSISTLTNNKNQKILDENTGWQDKPDNSDYAISKFRSELEAWRGKEEGLKVLVVIPSVIIGPGFTARSSGKIISMSAKGYPFYTSGTQGFIDVRDVAECMMKLVDSGNFDERFILTNENLSFKEVLSVLAQAHGNKAPKFKTGAKLLNVASYLEKPYRIITGSEPILTKTSISSMSENRLYSNQKLLNRIEHKFIPVADSLKFAVEMYKKSKS